MSINVQKWLISGYTGPGKPDMLMVAYDTQTGAINTLASACLGDNPSYLLCADGRYYVSFEVHDSSVAARIARLEMGNRGVSAAKRMCIPGAYGLCHMSFHGGFIYGSCWASGHVFCVDAQLEAVRWIVKNDDGSGLMPHAHWTAMRPDGLLLCADAGLDALLVYRPQDGAFVRAAPMVKGAAPRQMLLRANGLPMIVINEGAPSFHTVDERTLEIGATFSLPKGNNPGGACLTPQGLLLIPNRGPNSISLFDAKAEAPHLLGETACGGDFPRCVCASTDGKTVLSLNQRGNNVRFFSLASDRLEGKADVRAFGASCAVQIQ